MFDDTQLQQQQLAVQQQQRNASRRQAANQTPDNPNVPPGMERRRRRPRAQQQQQPQQPVLQHPALGNSGWRQRENAFVVPPPITSTSRSAGLVPSINNLPSQQTRFSGTQVVDQDGLPVSADGRHPSYPVLRSASAPAALGGGFPSLLSPFWQRPPEDTAMVQRGDGELEDEEDIGEDSGEPFESSLWQPQPRGTDRPW